MFLMYTGKAMKTTYVRSTGKLIAVATLHLTAALMTIKQTDILPYVGLESPAAVAPNTCGK